MFNGVCVAIVILAGVWICTFDGVYYEYGIEDSGEEVK